jgi:hypothetical protein
MSDLVYVGIAALIGTLAGLGVLFVSMLVLGVIEEVTWNRSR